MAVVSLKRVDFIFLVFLILTCQSFIPFKVFGIILAFVVRPTTKSSFKGILVFYLGIALLGIISTFNFFFHPDSNYFLVFSLGIFFWLLCLLCFFQIQTFVQSNTPEVRERTLQTFFGVNVFVSLVQLFVLVTEFKGNPYVNPSSGDLIKGIFQNSSVNMVVSSFYLVHFLFVNKKLWAIVSLLVCLSTTYLSGIVLFLAACSILLIVSYQVSLKLKMIFLVTIFFSVMLVTALSPSNLRYAQNVFEQIKSDRKPRKIISFWQTLEAAIISPLQFVFGHGMGNFSSRLAFIAGGEYATWYPKALIYRHPSFSVNHFSLWNETELAKPFNDGTANQPFSVYNQLLGEYGLIGLILFSFFYLNTFYRKSKKYAHAKLMLIAFCLYMVLDYWFEYFNVIILFEAIFLTDFGE